MIEKKELGARLKALRILYGKTQAEMAKMVEITPQQWAKYESGADVPGSEPLTRLCLEFDLSADILLGISKKGRENIPAIE